MILIHVLTFLYIFHKCSAEQQHVLELSDDDFSSKIASLDTVLVMFYAPWCGHCKALKPEYVKAAEHLKKHDPPIYLAKIDCTNAGKDTCNIQGVDGYPTLKIYRNSASSSQDYNGPRDATGIVKYMKAKLGPSSKEITSNDEFDKFINDMDVSLVGFFEEDTPLKDTFLEMADKLKERTRFAHTTTKDVLGQQGYNDTIVLYRPPYLTNKFENNFAVFEGNTTNQLRDFIFKKCYGLVGYRTPSNKLDFETPLVIAYDDVDYNRNTKGTNYWRNRILKVATLFQEKFTFAISSRDEFTDELYEYGIDSDTRDIPIIVAKDTKKQKFVLNETFSSESLETFIKDILNEKVKPFLKSAPIPESNSSPVKIAVAKNFEEIVINNGKDTMILFYAPWCGHCKKLLPAYDELPNHIQHEEISIVKMDATVNDVPSNYELHGFPTIYWAPKDSKQYPIKYEGRRKIDNLLEYIAKHATKLNKEKTEL